MKLKPGDQIAYIPDHVYGDNNEVRLLHSDVEFGFVTNPGTKGNFFCRYWKKGDPGRLRTTSCSELTPARCLVKFTSVTQGELEQVINGINANRFKEK